MYVLFIFPLPKNCSLSPNIWIYIWIYIWICGALQFTIVIHQLCTEYSSISKFLSSSQNNTYKVTISFVWFSVQHTWNISWWPYQHHLNTLTQIICDVLQSYAIDMSDLAIVLWLFKMQIWRHVKMSRELFTSTFPVWYQVVNFTR